MKNAQKPDHVSLNGLITRLREGRFVIPDFQREFEWRPWDIRDLMRSIFLDYYIGSLLLWKGTSENFQALACEPVWGHAGEKRPEYIVLDGQQRLTAMHYTFFAPDVPLPNRKNKFFYFIKVDCFMEERYDSAFEYGWLTRQWSKLLANPDEQYVRHIFPLSVMGKSGWELPNWVQGYQRFWENRIQTAQSSSDESEAKIAADNARGFGKHLKELTEQYQVSYIELDSDLEIGKVCDIFTQVNSRGVQLDTFDLINAMLKPKDVQLKYMWREAKPRLAFIDTERMNVYILQVMSILHQAYCSPKYLYYLLPGQEKPVRQRDGTRRRDVLVQDAEEFKRSWNAAVSSLQKAIDLLRHPQEFGAISQAYLPYTSILPVFASLQSHIENLSADRRADAQRKVRHWYWSSVFTNRYSGSVESTSARDFLDVKRWIEDDDEEPPVIRELESVFRDIDLKREIKRGTSRYNGIFNLLVIQGARDWITGNIPQDGDMDDHHIVPSSWAEGKELTTSINSILNRTTLSADTNRKVIRDRLPKEYLRELIQQRGKINVQSILASHFVSNRAMEILLRSSFSSDDYEEFILERQRTIKEAIENLLIKERLDLEPPVRKLDERVEKIELALRKTVLVTLSDAVDFVPRHVLQHVNTRIDQATRKSAAMDTDKFETLEGKLEFFDLRELQDTICSKNLWDKFANRFNQKESLVQRFDKLADLRNSIRHSRGIDEIMRKDGEAAILWFEQVLER
ncbi:MAG: DUF262 domain-containing protein [Candidatus Dadabacteria bacterium]|nr:DUF262 domain-containing protein [Candidatus Dadabacteria bacterium]